MTERAGWRVKSVSTLLAAVLIGALTTVVLPRAAQAATCDPNSTFCATMTSSQNPSTVGQPVTFTFDTNTFANGQTSFVEQIPAGGGSFYVVDLCGFVSLTYLGPQPSGLDYRATCTYIFALPASYVVFAGVYTFGGASVTQVVNGSLPSFATTCLPIGFCYGIASTLNPASPGQPLQIIVGTNDVESTMTVQYALQPNGLFNVLCPVVPLINIGPNPSGLTMAGVCNPVITTQGTYLLKAMSNLGPTSPTITQQIVLGGGSPPLATVATPPSVHVDDVIQPGEPVGAFLDPTNASPGGSVFFYVADVDFGLGGGQVRAQVVHANPGEPCPAALNDPSGVGCFVIETAAPVTDLSLTQTSSLSVAVTSETSGSQGRASAPFTIQPSRYEITMKAWIPFATVVDPVNPFGIMPATLVTTPLIIGLSGGLWPTCSMPPPLLAVPEVAVSSTLQGNNHPGVDGPFKVQTIVLFDWDGRVTSNYEVVGFASVSQRNISYSIGRGNKTWSCIMTKTATMSTTSGLIPSGQLGPDSFGIAYSSGTPLVTTAPTIDAQAVGNVAPDGTISLNFLTDGFPSHGLTIQRNGTLQQADILNDVTCMGSAYGPIAAHQIFKGLSGVVSATGTITDTPGQVGPGGVDQQTGLCSTLP
jgi:hypothetical protein